MYEEPIFLNPVFQERIWGGQRLKSLFDYPIPFEKTGEAWVIAAHKNGSSIVKNGPLKGWSLQSVWREYPELFVKQANDSEFPLLVKILDANDRLSVQVHPNDAYARNTESVPYGKTECWYILDCEEDAEIIYGHHAMSKKALREMAELGDWNKLLRKVKVKKGEFFYVPSGTIHAIGKGIVILEIQQNSDITYRIHDYDRIDTQGKKREIHLDKAVDVVTVPGQVAIPKQSDRVSNNFKGTQLVHTPYFTVYHLQLNGQTEKPFEAYFLLVTVIEGNGNIEIAGKKYEFGKGDNFILPVSMPHFSITGNCELIISHP